MDSRSSPAQSVTPFRSWLRALRPLWGLLSSLGLAGLLAMALSLVITRAPFDIVAAFYQGAWGNMAAAVTTLNKITPLLLTGLAVALAYRVGLLNIGCEGQLTLGALAAASFAVALRGLPPLLLAPLTLGAGALVGAGWAYPAVWLRQRRDVHEVISTLLLNYVALFLADYLVRGPLGDGSAMARSPEIPGGAAWPLIFEVGTAGLTLAPFMVLLLSLLVQIWLSRTVWGFEVTATGTNLVAAQRAGIAVQRWRRRLFVVSGALAGLAGALEVVAVHHRFYAAFSPGYGFDGITVAFLVNACPGWLWMSSLLLASLRAADKWLQLALGVSPNVVWIIVAVLLLAVTCQTKWPQGLLRSRREPGGYQEIRRG
jgi:general nucleoside transport system permease protein